jgi:Na+-transporting NADH:ubiquinone oxidoreductase subunit C
VHSNSYTFIFAASLTIVFSFLLSLAYTQLKPIQDANFDAYVKSNILTVAGIETKEGDDIKDVFAKNIEQKFINVSGEDIEVPETDAKKFSFVKEHKSKGVKTNLRPNLNSVDKKLRLPIYIRKDDTGKPMYYILPVHGMGLWSLIEGYIALESDVNTIAGITFYSQLETAGLGAEIQQKWFTDSYKGKKVFDNNGQMVSVNIKKGKIDSSVEKEKNHMVDGISGATLTGDGINEFMIKDLLLYENFLKKIKNAEVKEEVIEKTEEKVGA